MSELYGWDKEVAATGGEPGVHDLMNVQEKSPLPARFELIPKKMGFKSEQAGRPIFEDVLHISIYMPGGDVVCRLVQEADKDKWPHAWEAYQKGMKNPSVGLPLEQWPEMSPATVANLKAANIFTVENLAALSDAHCEAIGGHTYDFRDKAKAYFERAKGADLDDLKAQNLELQAKLAEKEAHDAEVAETMAEMQKQIAALKKPKRRPVRRKRKARNVTPNADTSGNRPDESADA